jgi:hypothetical protein
MHCVLRCSLAAALAAIALAAPALAGAQNSPRSAALAKELVDILSRNKLDTIAARDPLERDRFIAAMSIPGQLMVVTGKYTVPVLLDEKISFNKFKDVYIELNAAAVPASKIFIEDLFADGIVTNRKQSPFDTWMEAGKTTLFDGDHRKVKMSKEDYAKQVQDADARYSKLLELLIAQAKQVK